VRDALSVVTDAGLSLVTSGEEHSPSPGGVVIRQSPDMGSLVRSGRPVEVVLSLGPRALQVPDLVGKTRRQADVLMEGMGLSVGSAASMHSPAPPGEIIAQRPGAGTAARRDAQVDVLLSLGPRPLAYLMPELRDRSIQDAVQALDDAGLLVAEVSSRQNTDAVPGQVLAQIPLPGTRITQEQGVRLAAAAMHGEEGGQGSLAIFHYRVPSELASGRIRIEVENDLGRQTLMDEWRRPGERVQLLVRRKGRTRVRVFLSDILAEVREL
jgi:serine/threonine-protein kinase